MKKFTKIFFILILLAGVLVTMTGCGYEIGGFTVIIKSVTVHADGKTYNAYRANDITKTVLTGDSSQFDYAEEIEVQAHLPSYGYNQHLTLKHNGKTVLEEQAYSAASAKVKLDFGENVFEWYLNLPTDGEKAHKVSFTIKHTPPVILPPVLWIHYGQGVFQLSNLGVATKAVEVETATTADNMTYYAEVYYKNAEGSQGEFIGAYDTEIEGGAGFELPVGVGYDNVIVYLYYAPDSPQGVVPNVIGLSVQDAIETLKAHGYDYEIFYAENNHVQKDYIYNQYDAGTVKPKGYKVTIFGSLGPEKKRDNKEEKELSAEARLERLEFIRNSEIYGMDPDFSPDIYSYELAGWGAENAKINAVPIDSNATVNGDGTIDWEKAEDGKWKIIVTAEDGVTTCVYTLNFYSPEE